MDTDALHEYENITDLLSDIELIRNSNHTLVGVSIKPDTDVSAITHILKLVDLVLIMSVVPGKSGQKFIESSLDKIRELRSIILDNGYNVLIEVDGGINGETAPTAVNADVDVLVAGSYVFDSGDMSERVKLLRKL